MHSPAGRSTRLSVPLSPGESHTVHTTESRLHSDSSPLAITELRVWMSITRAGQLSWLADAVSGDFHFSNVGQADLVDRTWLCYIRVFTIANLSVCLSVCKVRAPYSQGWSFWQYFFAGVYLSHPLTSVQNFRKIITGNPSVRGVNAIKKGSKLELFWTCWRLYLTNGTRYGLGYN